MYVSGFSFSSLSPGFILSRHRSDFSMFISLIVSFYGNLSLLVIMAIMLELQELNAKLVTGSFTLNSSTPSHSMSSSDVSPLLETRADKSSTLYL